MKKSPLARLFKSLVFLVLLSAPSLVLAEIERTIFEGEVTTVQPEEGQESEFASAGIVVGAAVSIRQSIETATPGTIVNTGANGFAGTYLNAVTSGTLTIGALTVSGISSLITIVDNAVEPSTNLVSDSWSLTQVVSVSSGPGETGQLSILLSDMTGKSISSAVLSQSLNKFPTRTVVLALDTGLVSISIQSVVPPENLFKKCKKSCRKKAKRTCKRRQSEVAKSCTKAKGKRCIRKQCK